MRGPWSLRRRLVVALVALLAVVSVIVGAASVLALRESLMQRLDQQVIAELRFVERADGPGAPGQIPDDDGPGETGARSSVRLVISGTAVEVAEYIDEDRTSTTLTVAQQRAMVDAAAARPTTIDVPGLGEFRIVAEQMQGRVYVVGLSLEEVDETTSSLILIFAIVTLAALAVAALAGSFVVRVALRPLERVAATATRVLRAAARQGRGGARRTRRLRRHRPAHRGRQGRLGPEPDAGARRERARLPPAQRRQGAAVRRRRVARAAHAAGVDPRVLRG